MNRRDAFRTLGGLVGGTLGASMFGLSGCNYLDIEPTDMKTGDMVWTDRKQTEDVLYDIYAPIPTPAMNTGWGFEGLSDEMDFSWNVYWSYPINLGNWNSTSAFQNFFATFYKAIRTSLTFEANVDRNPQLSNDLKKQYKAESKFLRGYYYWLLFREYGPVPLIKELKPVSADWQIPRSPVDDVVAYIVQMMEEAQKDLPVRWESTDPQWVGKADQLICKSIKAAVLTHVASPQFNGNSAYSSFRNKDGTSLTSTTFDKNKWQLAADANLEVIKMAESAGIKLYRNNENGNGTTFSPFKSVKDLYSSWNPEVIWGKSNYNPAGWAIHASPGPNNLGGSGPTQRLVDAFFMKNGRWITDTKSNYVEDGFASEGGEFYKPSGLDPVADRVNILNSIKSGDSWGHWPGDWNMYANREPRFYANILYNKRIIPQLPTDAEKRDYYSSPSQKNGYGRAELYYGGTSRQSGSYTFYSRTGYLVLKRIDFGSNLRDRAFVATKRPQILIRYAKVLLDYVECLNEVDPNHPDIPKYWNDIRSRAGIPDIYEVYPEIKGDKDKQRDHILRERQVELCFDFSFDRYFTTRRRLLAATPDNGDPMRQYGDGGAMYGMDINAGDPGTNSFATTSFYRRVPFETRVFDNKMYLSPLPQSEIDRNPQMVQNPGW